MCYAIPATVDYRKVSCSVAERACADEMVLIFQQAILGTRSDMEFFAEAIRKVQHTVNP